MIFIKKKTNIGLKEILESKLEWLKELFYIKTYAKTFDFDKSDGEAWSEVLDNYDQ